MNRLLHIRGQHGEWPPGLVLFLSLMTICCGCREREDDGTNAVAVNPSSVSEQSITTAGSRLAKPIIERLTDPSSPVGLGVIAMKSATTIAVDGVLNKDEWSNAIETSVPDMDEKGNDHPCTVRLLWTPRELRVAVTAAEQPNEKQSDPGYCSLVFYIAGKSSRFYFLTGTDDIRTSHVITAERCIPLSLQSWTAHTQHGPSDVTTEFVLSPEAIDISAFAAPQELCLVVSTSQDRPAVPEPDDPGIYWLLCSARGVKFEVILIDPAEQSWPSLEFENGTISTNMLIGWRLTRVDLPTAKEWDLHIWLAVSSALAENERIEVWTEVSPSDEQKISEPILSAHQILVILSGSVVRSELRIPPVREPGTYDVAIISNAEGAPRKLGSVRVLVSDEWRRDLRRYIVAKRDHFRITTGLDPVHAAVMEAHFSNVFQLIDGNKGIESSLLHAVGDLETALESAVLGKMPKAPLGSSKLSYVNLQGEHISFTLHIPVYYDADLPWPIYWGEPRLALPAMIHVEMPQSPGSVLHLLTQLLNVDEDRVYLVAHCAEAYPGTDALVRHPDIWAAAVLVLQAKWSPLWTNVRHIPFLLYNNDSNQEDMLILKSLWGRLKEQGCECEYKVIPNLGHSFLPQQYHPALSKWLLRYRRVSKPQQVRYVTDGYENTRAYWVQIDAIEDEASLASLSAELNGDTITVGTDNVISYTLFLDKSPLKSTLTGLRIIENGHEVAHVDSKDMQEPFHRKPAVDQPVHLVKQAGLAGPIRDLASRDCVVIWGDSGNNAELIDAAHNIADKMGRHGSWLYPRQISSDKEALNLQSHSGNLILIGNIDSNRWIHEIEHGLPIKVQNNQISAGGRVFDAGRCGYILLYPSPLNQDRYVLLIVGNTADTLDAVGRAFLEFTMPLAWNDVLIGELIGTPEGIKWHLMESFEYNWSWPENDPVLAVVKQAHPDWQWEQWIDKILCQELNADGFVSPNGVLNTSASAFVGPLRGRSLRRWLGNRWLLRIGMPKSRLGGFVRKISLDPKSRSSHLNGGTAPVRIYSSSKPKVKTDELEAIEAIVLLAIENDERVGNPKLSWQSPSWWPPLCAYAEHCTFSDQFVADCVIHYLNKNPPIDLDRILSDQTMGSE